MTSTTKPDEQAEESSMEVRSSSDDRRHFVAAHATQEGAVSTASERTLAVQADPPSEDPKTAAPERSSGHHRSQRTKDFGFIPIPRWRRYDPAKPFQFSMFLNYIFAFAATFTVANLYYCQPLLVQFSQSFNVSYGETTLIPTLLQAGYATGLLFIAPAGDMLRRRQLVLLLTIATTVLAIGLAAVPSFAAFEALSFLMGIFTVTPQIMMPLAADLAPQKRRAQSMAIVLSGLMLGILVARVLGGIIAEFASWRDVYWMSVGAQALVGLLLYYTLPDYPPKNPDLRYLQIHPTMLRFLYTNPTLIHGCLLGLVASANFAGFWVTLTFLLSASPYQYSTLVIGLFGVIGIGGICLASFVGKIIDKLVAWVAAVTGNLIMLIAVLMLLGASQVHIAAVVVAIVLLDIGQQINQVANQSRIYSTQPDAGARLNSIYIISLFIGQLIGSSLCSKVFLEYGAREYYALSCGLIGLNLAFCMCRGPLKENKRWIGWGRRDDWTFIKRKAPPQMESTVTQEVEKTAPIERDLERAPASLLPKP